MNLVWSDTAIETYLHIVDYIYFKWTKRKVNNFRESVDQLLEKLTFNNQLCPPSKLLHFRKCVVSKQTSLIYSIQKDSIYLVTFIDNRALHDF